MDREEYRKCCDSLAYFYNNYILVKDANGKWVKPSPITDEQIAEAAKRAKQEEQKQFSSLKNNFAKKMMAAFPQAFEGKVFLNENFKEELI